MEGRTITFNGDSNVKEFITRVELLSALNGYSGEKSAQYLASKLEGPAFDVYLRLGEEDRKNVTRLQQELLVEFEKGHANREEALFTLSNRVRNPNESAYTYAYKLKELVKLAYPSFDSSTRTVIAKDYFVRGLHSDMQLALKSMEKFANCDIDSLAEETTRLQLAGITSVYQSCQSIEAVNVTNPGTTIPSEILDSIAAKVVDKLSGSNKNAKTGGWQPSKLEANFANSLSHNQQNNVRGKYEKSRSYQSPYQEVSRGKYQNTPDQQRKCRCCQSTTHLLKNCPARFCQNCGQRGHDSKDQVCPKFHGLASSSNTNFVGDSCAVVVAAKLHNFRTHAMLDTGSGASVLDLGTLQKIGLDAHVDKTSAKSLINASCDKMKILGSVHVKVTLPGSQPRDHVFQVLDSVTYTNILLGRDFMKKFGAVRFDFSSNIIELGTLAIKGLSTACNNVRLCENTVIPARSEKVLFVKCSTINSLLEGDFEPQLLPNVNGVYATRSRVIPNIDGLFPITVLNVTPADIYLPSRKSIGSIQPTSVSMTSDSPGEGAAFNINDITLSDNLSATENTNLMSMIMDYKDVFATNPRKPRKTHLLEHRIITNDALPVYHKPRRIPVAWEKEVDDQVSEMLRNGIIRPSYSPWNAPVILVKKKDNTTRFVCDFRGVNDVTKKDTYPLPHIKDVIDKMAGSQYWSTLDAASAYWSIPLSETDKEKTAFAVPRGKFEFNVMPFGLSNSGASYQRMMDICLSGLRTDKVLSYMDDIVVFSTTFDEHVRDLKAVFECLRTANVTLKASKCVFAAQKVEFLGFELSVDGIKPQKRLTNAINQLPHPESKKELRRFLGMAGFYRTFIKDFATLSQPLNRLTGDNVKFVWDTSCEAAFLEIKQHLMCEPILAFPKLNDPFIVEVDASDYAAGGILSQKGEDGILHPIAYFSTSFTNTQRKWAPVTKEAFALVLAVRHWHVYLSGTEFVLRSDHNPLVHLRQQKDPRGKFGRWIAELEEYNYTVEYIRGKDNVKADFLSRNPAANFNQPPSTFEENVFATAIDNTAFVEQLRQEQDTDPVINKTKRLITHGENIVSGRFKRVQNQLRIVNNILTKSGRPVVPPSLKNFIVSEVHCAAHFGTEKTYLLLKDRFFWPNMYGYVKNFVSQCLICQQTKSDPSPPKAPLTPMATPEAPMEFLSIDIAYMPPDQRGFKYFLLIGDIFSKYIQAVPLKDQTATDIADALLSHWIYIHGAPYFLLSDQGSNVDGTVIKEICNLLKIEKRRSSAYHSQGNGFAERNIRSVKDMLRAVLLQRKAPQHKWRSLLPELVFALNTSVSKVTQCIPYNVIFGRYARLPIDVLFSIDPCPTVDVTTPATYAQDRSFILEDTYKTVLQNLQLSKERMQAQYNKNLRFHDYKEGDQVWLKVKYYKTGENRKLSPRRNGPWTVIRKLPNGVNFEILNDKTREQKIVHHDRLNPCRIIPFVEPSIGYPNQPTTTTVSAKGKNVVNDTVYPSANSEESSKDSEESASSESEIEYDNDSDTDVSDNDHEIPDRRYPQRQRRARQLPENIPWNAIKL